MVLNQLKWGHSIILFGHIRGRGPLRCERMKKGSERGGSLLQCKCLHINASN